MKYTFENNDLTMVAIERTSFRGYPMLFHRHMEILCVTKGEIKVCVDGTECVLRPGMLCVVFPYVLHSYEDAPDAAFRLLMVSPFRIPDFSGILSDHKPVCPFLAPDETVSFLFDRAVACMQSDDPLGESTACAYTAALVGEILHRCTLTQEYSTKNETIRRILNFCSEHASENISIHTVSTACFVSESYVSKVFAREIGVPFRTYLNRLRVAQAKRLLEGTNLKMVEIMVECGFHNQSSFNRIFFDLCGTTPRQYRTAVR